MNQQQLLQYFFTCNDCQIIHIGDHVSISDQLMIHYQLRDNNYNGLLVVHNPLPDFWKYISHHQGVIRHQMGIIAYHGTLNWLFKHDEIRQLFV